jgi:hypothetical protein
VAAKRRVPKKPAGRPSKYTPEMADTICQAIGGGMSLRRLCKDNDDVPDAQTVRRWMLGQGIPPEHLASFRLNYGEARRLYEEHVFEELGDVRTEGGQADVPRDTLWSNNVKWSLARMNRAKYGDRSELGIAGVEGGVPVTTSNVSVNLANLGPKDQAKLRELARQAIAKEED